LFENQPKHNGSVTSPVTHRSQVAKLKLHKPLNKKRGNISTYTGKQQMNQSCSDLFNSLFYTANTNTSKESSVIFEKDIFPSIITNLDESKFVGPLPQLEEFDNSDLNKMKIW